MNEITTGGLLNGRVTYHQFATGHRSGFEPVLLAASVPAKAGQFVLEAGTGAGAALLCLATRVPGVLGCGLERDEPTAQLANENFKINKLYDIFVVQGDIENPPFAPRIFDHVLANPPWFDAKSTASPDARRAMAHQATPDLLGRWIASLTRVLRPQGSITLILPAASFGQATAALRGCCGGITLTPLWPRAGVPAKMILLAARLGSKAPDIIRPGLVLHEGNAISPAAQAVLRDGAALT
jgi:tRNA1Val (adenine37-N6)-methyltransferase